MSLPEQRKIIPAHRLFKGPDLMRGNPNTEAFVYTKYPNPKTGSRYQSRSGDTGHEQFITEPDVVEAIFGPKLDTPSPKSAALAKELEGLPKHHWKRGEYEKVKDNTLRDELVSDVPTWKKDDEGKLVYPLEAEKTTRKYTWEPVRMWAKSEALIGRKGEWQGSPLVMLWPWAPASDTGWVPLLQEMIQELNLPDDTIITMGINDQFLAGDFKGNQKKKIANSVSGNMERDKDCLDMMARYHTATGPDKAVLRDILKRLCNHSVGNPGVSYPDVADMSDKEIEEFPWRGSHWQLKMQKDGMVAPGQKWWSMHGDSTDLRLSFRNFLQLVEGNCGCGA